MSFTVYVASDCFGQKLNLELEFPYAPTLGELTQAVEAAFTAEQSYRRPGHAGAYQVSKFLSVDEITDDWIEVTAASQLRNYCQIYSFQPHSTRYTETQGHIPPATKPRSALYGGGMAAASPAPMPRSMDMGPPGSIPRGLEPYPVPAGQKLLPENPTHDDKVRITFEEIDTNRNRVIEMEEWKKAHEICEFQLSTETAEDLLRKCDTDKDGVLNFPEWQRFSELYPQSHDCIYFRYKHHYDKLATEARIEAAKKAQKPLQDEKEAADKQVAMAEEDGKAGEKRVEDSEKALGEAQGRQRAADDAAREQQRKVDDARASVDEAARQLADEREKERQAQLRAADSERDLQAANRRKDQAEQAAAVADAAEQRARAALEEAQREKERQLKAAEDAKADAQRAQDRHDEILGKIPQTVDDARKKVAEAEIAAREQDQKHRDLTNAAIDAARACDDAARARDDASRNVLGARDRKEPAQQAADLCQRRLDEHDKRIQEMEDEARKADDKGKALWDQENKLVEQEIRLREQRDQLEQKESALRTAASDFVAVAGRLGSAGAAGSPAPAYGRSPGGYDAYGTPPRPASRW